MKISISAEELAQSRTDLESTINGYTHKVKSKLERYAKLHTDPGLETAVDMVYEGFGAIDLLWKRFVKAGAGKEESILIAVAVASDYASQGMQTQNHIFRDKIDFSRPYPYPLDDLLRVYSSELDRSAHLGLENLTSQFFDWVKCSVQIDESKIDINIGNYSYGKFKSNGLGWDKFGGYHDAVQYFKNLILITENIDYCLSLKTLDIKDLIPKGTLLVGPPGTGKTTLARIFCNEAKIPFDIFSVSEVGSSFVYESARKIQQKFDLAAKYIKNGERFSLLFIDELDSLGKTRGNNSREDDKVVTTINSCMDGHLAADGVIVIGATNRVDVLDPALTRPGRFSEMLYMGSPTIDEVKEIFGVYKCDNLDLDYLISQYPINGNGYMLKREISWTGAMIRNVIVKAKRKKIVSHLLDGKDYAISTKDICVELEGYKNGRS